MERDALTCSVALAIAAAAGHKLALDGRGHRLFSLDGHSLPHATPL
ncbi:MAG: hypothetical protein WA294_20195 [Acidobacteriaceae bacterium]